jgi:PKD repeat protein
VFTQGKGTRNPIIQSFTATPTNVTQGQAITFQVLAHDPDGQPLQFNWSATDGTLSTNTGQVVSWTPPAQPGTYTVMATVSNGQGGFATGAHNLIVQADGSAKIGVTPMASSVPTVLISPSAIPSVAISPVVTPLPVPSATPSPSPVASPTASPQPSPSPTRSSVLLLPFTSQEAFAPALKRPGTNTLLNREYRTVSASGQRYSVRYQVVSRTEFGSGGFGETTSNDLVGGAAGIYQVIMMQFAPYKSAADPADILRVNVRLKDDVDGFYDLNRTAVKFPEANWAFPADVSDELKPLDGTCYVFKHDGTDTSPLTFHLP